MWQHILSLTCIVPALTGTILYKKQGKNFYPVIYQMWLFVITELATSIALLYYNSIAGYSAAYNAFGVINLALVFWFFYKQNIIKVKHAIVLMVICIVLKLLNTQLDTPWGLLRQSTIYDSLVAVVLSVMVLQKMLLNPSKQKLVTSALFMLMITYIFSYSFDALNTVVGWIFPASKVLIKQLNNILVYSSIISYIFFTYVFLCPLLTKK